LWQENRATRNNIFGLLLPQSVLPSISGPVLETTSFASVWGSAGGVLASYEPFDFGARKANVELARALHSKAEAASDVTQLDVESAAADAFLVLAAAKRSVTAAEANVSSLAVFARSVHVLVDNQLRPGADASRADAELAVARNQLIQAQEAEEISRAGLAEAIGAGGTSIEIAADSLKDPPRAVDLPPLKAETHPLAREGAAAVQAVEARERILDRSYVPRFQFQFALYGRGSGAAIDGSIDNSKGLVPDVSNWAAGVTITFPPLGIFSYRAQRRIESGNEGAERANYDQVIQHLNAEEMRARAAVEAALRIAGNIPVQLNAARETLTRARARYDAGLGTVVEVADAQHLQVQAEIDDAIAGINVWRAILGAARVRGDTGPFLRLIRQAVK
jgi:outer membrane protein TolC